MPNQKMSNKPDERECYLCGAKYRKKYLYRNGLSIKICNKCVENVNNIYKVNGQKPPKFYNESICWHCKNAVPARNINGVYERGCSWSIKFKPVSGWIAGKKEYVSKNKFKNQLRTAYFVAYCPEFEKG